MTAELETQTPVQHPAQRAASKIDGRNMRRDRNKIAVTDAYLDLVSEGALRPSVAQVAERSGVSHRSVFRYFADTDELARASIARQVTRLEGLLDTSVDSSSPVLDRIDLVIERRMKLFAAAAPVARLARVLAPEHDVMRAELEQNRALYRLQLSRMFLPELSAMDDECSAKTIAVLDVLCSFDTYDLLLADQGLAPEMAAAALRHVLVLLLS